MAKRLQSSAKSFSIFEAAKNGKSQTAAVAKKTASAAPKKASGFGAFLSLEPSMKDPALQVYNDPEFVCIRDKYPKSRLHLLLIPLPSASDGIKLLKVEQLLELADPVGFLKKCRDMANDIITIKVLTSQTKYPSKTDLMIGFHAVQSMTPLHIHIISTDFKSDCLKNKKHWNSFNSEYFIHLEKLIEELELVGGRPLDYFRTDRFLLRRRDKLEELLKQDLKCHKCRQAVKNMPELKKHLDAEH